MMFNGLDVTLKKESKLTPLPYHYCHVGGYVDALNTHPLFGFIKERDWEKHQGAKMISSEEELLGKFSAIYTMTWVRLVIWKRITIKY